MECVILGLKNKEDNSLKVYDVSYKGDNHTDIAISDSVRLDIVSPYPFSHFSSLSYDKDVFKTHDPIYLLVDAELTERDVYNAFSGSKASHCFEDRRITVLSEFDKPFEYGLEQLRKYGDKLGTYDFVTWIIHEEAKSEKEFESMCQLLKIDVENEKKKKPYQEKYPMDISLDKFTLPYVDFLTTLDEKFITFGSGGHISITKEDMQNIPISEKGLLFLMNKISKLGVLIYHPAFNVDFYKKNIENTPLETKFYWNLYEKDIPEFKKIGFDMDYLFSRVYKATVEKDIDYYDDYEPSAELISNANYEPITLTYDPHEFYCCEECDGYRADWSEEPYDYQVDEQVGLLRAVIGHYEPYLTEKSYVLFEDWHIDIFRRYIKENPESSFVKEYLIANESKGGS